MPITLVIADDHPLILDAMENLFRLEKDLKADDHNARVTVSDNGCGFPFRGHYDDAALTSTGLGPVVIKSRVASLGGALNIDSSESGARLEVTLPLSSPRA